MLCGVCGLVKSREGECVMLAASSSLQAGDPGLETGHLGLLREDKNTSFDKDTVKKFTDTHAQRDFLYSYASSCKTAP